MRRRFSVFVLLIALAACTPSPPPDPADYAGWTMQQCFTLGGAASPAEGACIHEVIHETAEESNRRYHEAEAYRKAHPLPLTEDERAACEFVPTGKGIHETRPDDAECNAVRKKFVEEECTIAVELGTLTTLKPETRNEPDCQQAIDRATAKKKADAAKAKAAENTREKKRLVAIERLAIPENQKKSLREKQVFIGATEEMERLAWGVPDHINTTETARTTHEQWVYGSQCLYFDNGILTSSQTLN